MSEPDLPQTGDAAPMELPPATRRLLRLVYIMGVVFVLLLVTLVVGIIWKANRNPPPKPEPPLQTLNLGLPAGAGIRSAALDGNTLVINTGREVIVVDVRKNSIIARISAGP